MPKIELRKVSKWSGKRTLVRDFSLEIRDREFLTILGPPGSGKSAVLRLIAGLEDPDKGEILIDGRRVNGVPPVKRNVSVVFQSLALYPHMTVRENLAFALKKLKMSEAAREERINMIAGMLSISGLLDRRPAQLSGGEKQRVALGRALVKQAGVILLDEPLGHLDAKLRVSARTEIKKLQRSLGQTVVMSTVDAVDALSIADRVAVMKDGQLIQIDTPENVVENPRNVFVARSLGLTQINTFKGRIETRNGRLFVTSNIDAIDASRHEDRLRDRVGEEVTVGIRPVDVTLSDKPSRVMGTVDLMEPLGSDVLVRVLVNGEALTAKVRLSEAKFVSGRNVSISFPTDKVLLFDGKGENLLS